jgi:hypothetical protein
MKIIKNFEAINFTVVATVHEYRVDYVAYDICSYTADPSDPAAQPLYDRKGSISFDPVEDLEQAKQFVHGEVKWDGCSNWHFDEQDELMIHGCGRDDIARIGLLLGQCWDWAKELLPTWINQ